jgi:hypothetical protein
MLFLTKTILLFDDFRQYFLRRINLSPLSVNIAQSFSTIICFAELVIRIMKQTKSLFYLLLINEATFQDTSRRFDQITQHIDLQLLFNDCLKRNFRIIFDCI